MMIIKSPVEPPSVPAFPMRGIATLLPLSDPAGIVIVTDFCLETSPVPRHLEHGLSIIVPFPLQREHAEH